MLKGISPLFSPELLACLYRMGHGDEIVLADAHYPGDSHNQRIIRADGLAIPDLLEAILQLMPLDQYVDCPVYMMAPVADDTCDPVVKTTYQQCIQKYESEIKSIAELERFEFYKRSKTAYAILMTGDTNKYANIILKKGICL